LRRPIVRQCTNVIVRVPIRLRKSVSHKKENPSGSMPLRGCTNFALAICASHPTLVRCGSADATAALLGRFLPRLGPLAIAGGPIFISTASSNSRCKHGARRGFHFSQSGNPAPSARSCQTQPTKICELSFRRSLHLQRIDLRQSPRSRQRGQSRPPSG
jgi:hypothetical protein